jgi:hypothetical protein
VTTQDVPRSGTCCCLVGAGEVEKAACSAGRRRATAPHLSLPPLSAAAPEPRAGGSLGSPPRRGAAAPMSCSGAACCYSPAHRKRAQQLSIDADFARPCCNDKPSAEAHGRHRACECTPQSIGPVVSTQKPRENGGASRLRHTWYAPSFVVKNSLYPPFMRYIWG